MEPITFLEPYARLLVVLHAAASIVLIGATTHHAIISYGYLRAVYKTRLGRIYASTAAVVYLVTWILGALAYPTFRYHVRALYLDRYEPWASNLFDIKEHFASIGLPLVAGVFILSRVMNPKEDRSLLFTYAVMVFGTAAIVWFNVFSGIIITLEKGV
jgi:hypothetical protein